METFLPLSLLSLSSPLPFSLSFQFKDDFTFCCAIFYRVFHGFGQAKFAYGGSILGSSQFTLLPQLPLKTMLSVKVVKIDSKISNSLPH